MDLDENMFAQLLSQEGWGSTAPAQPSPYELIYKLFEQIKHLKYGQEYLMKKVHWLDHKSNQNMMELEALKPVKPVKNVIAVNPLELSERDFLLKRVEVGPGQTIEIQADAAASFGVNPAKLQIYRGTKLVAESTALDPTTFSRQPSEVAAVVYKETLGAVGVEFFVKIGNGNDKDFGIAIAPYNC